MISGCRDLIEKKNYISIKTFGGSGDFVIERKKIVVTSTLIKFQNSIQVQKELFGNIMVNGRTSKSYLVVLGPGSLLT